MKTKILYINGYGDFTCADLEEENKINGIIEHMLKNNLTEYEIEDGLCTILEFNEVDEEFIKFTINQLMDYDLQKQCNIYLIK